MTKFVGIMSYEWDRSVAVYADNTDFLSSELSRLAADYWDLDIGDTFDDFRGFELQDEEFSIDIYIVDKDNTELASIFSY